MDRQISTLLHHLETQIIDGRVLSPVDDNAVDTWAKVLTQIAAAPGATGLRQTLADFEVSARTDAKNALAANKIETAAYLLTFAGLASDVAQHGFNTALGQPGPNTTPVTPDLSHRDEPQQKIPDGNLALGSAPPSSLPVDEDPVPLAPAPVKSQLPLVLANPLPDDTLRQSLIPAPAPAAPAAQTLAGSNATVGPSPHDTNAPVVASAPTAMFSTAIAPMVTAVPADPLPAHTNTAPSIPATIPGGPPSNAPLAATVASPKVTPAPAARAALPPDNPSARTVTSTSGSPDPAGSAQPAVLDAQTAIASPAAAAPVMSPTSDGTTQVATATPVTDIPSPDPDDHTSPDTLDERAARLALETHDGAAAATLIAKLVRSEAFQPATDAALLARGDAMMRNKDIAAARKLYQSAANAGNAHAALSLARSYDPAFNATFEAKGAAPDTERAITWYRRATNLGAPEARTRLQALMTKTTR